MEIARSHCRRAEQRTSLRSCAAGRQPCAAHLGAALHDGQARRRRRLLPGACSSACHSRCVSHIGVHMSSRFGVSFAPVLQLGDLRALAISLSLIETLCSQFTLDGHCTLCDAAGASDEDQSSSLEQQHAQPSAQQYAASRRGGESSIQLPLPSPPQTPQCEARRSTPMPSHTNAVYAAALSGVPAAVLTSTDGSTSAGNGVAPCQPDSEDESRCDAVTEHRLTLRELVSLACRKVFAATRLVLAPPSCTELLPARRVCMRQPDAHC